MDPITGITAGATILGGKMQSDAADDAARSQADSSAASIAEQRRQFDLTRNDFAPYRAAGVKSLGLLQDEMNRMPTAEEVMSQPGYQFGLHQGQQAIDRQAAAAGGRVSGARLKAANEYATNYATNGYNAAYQRQQDRLNRLAALSGVGQSATGASSAAGQSSANAISQILSNQGDAAGAARIAQGNIWGGAINQIGAIAKRKWK